jgi:hypothetical protein
LKRVIWRRPEKRFFQRERWRCWKMVRLCFNSFLLLHSKP